MAEVETSFLSDPLVQGLIGVTVSIVAWGSFMLPTKTKSVQDAKLDAMVFNAYMGIGIFLSSLPVLLFVPFAFTWWSTAGAALFAPGCVFCVLTVEWIGIAKGQAIWAGCVALQSFLCGLIGFQETPMDLTLTLVGGVILLTGIGTLAFVEVSPPEEGGEKVPLKEAEDGVNPMEREEGNAVQPIKGLFGCLMIGLLCGSCMVPFRLSPAVPFQDGANSAIYAIGFGASLMIINFILLGLKAMIYGMPEFHPETCAVPGITAGMLWNIGNMGNIFACLPPLGLAVGYPLTQCCLLVAGLWGILIYGEIRGTKNLSTFGVGALITLVGAAMLGVYGKSA
mmetsp:Transcript_1154/g.1610  ORF Transcript_1154/g.1610 Transcript_1154/m.1610 type:complete len:338 (+) Transcript_1154:81-1094(+)|eukprot:CAMPEP_0167749374 /NCGR_PEP_ID=MMETSP0110_2-20121227/5369_1 /TAXON_ID=629695 /ORGANISM="Gymnochlora sp., Strain CCMP2014" /LENGTH=337 /DNA_ID=CAMNT_0007634515 /DNA_START=55 /DNA_END=1068 /DNA_ORIENTATION=-